MLDILEQIILEDTFSRKQIHTVIRQEIEQDLEENMAIQYIHCLNQIEEYRHKSYYKSKNIRIASLPDTDTCVMELIIAILHLDRVTPIQSTAAKLGRALGYEDPFDAAKIAADIIAICRDSKLYRLIMPRDSDTGYLSIQSLFKLNQDTIDKISMYQYQPPMVCKPQEVIHNGESGLINSNQSVVLGKNNHHEEYLALDVINIASRIKLSLDTDMLKIEEEPNKPLKTVEADKQFRQLKRESSQVYQLMLDHGNEFYLLWAYDKRGRIYSRGYHINIQSTAYKKSLINLAKKEIIKG